MVLDFNRESAGKFVEALRAGDKELALWHALAVTRDPDAANYGVVPNLGYTWEELANLIEHQLVEIDRGNWNMTWACHLPIVVGAIAHWLAEALNGADNGKTDRQSLEQSPNSDASGT